MAWTPADLDVINAAIATGARRVRFQTHEVEYHSLADLLKARDAIKSELEPAGPENAGVLFSEFHGGY